MTSSDSWKDQFLDASERLELEQSERRDERFALQRLLVRTSLAAEGQGPDLDEQLGELRELMRSNDVDLAALKSIQSRLDQLLDELDADRQRSERALGSALATLMDIVRRQARQAGMKDEFKSLERCLPTGRERGVQLAGWLECFGRLLQRLQDQSPRDPGPLKRWFGVGHGSRGKEGQETEDAEQAEPQPHASNDMTELSDGEAEESLDQRLRIARRVCELLDHVLDQVVLPARAHARASHLRERLESAAEWEDLREALNEVADLVIAAVSRSQTEFEAFLRRLDDRLAMLKEDCDAQAEATNDRRSDAEALDLDVAEQLDAMGSLVKTTDDMSELKRSVNDRVQAIAGAFRDFRSRETEREKRLEAKLATMREKLAGMEVYSEEMKRRLQEERRRALTDALTDLPNRESWQERFEFEFERWQRYRNPVVLAMLDIDHFKQVNDNWGHKAGDRVIQLVARTIRQRLRSTDFVARYGGEEFVLLLPQTTLEDGCRVLDSLREYVAELPFHFQRTPVRVTFSAGLIDFAAGGSPDSLFDRADQALYEAKEAGRNRIRVAGS
ncbi:GGDEF domain-containing protein [Tamilnaduibacter salinus]|uniref:diguanylate cyclase n=1 Tax=Tamilnaduibacter salinus TaxID=1484056 RepID=A0A2A2I2Q8_9GAMM|nr:GGDEF domain-containing protein [Tamilnaduibacter salinus]PAV25425.1 GGDEF domain-containing protein [Tamilnaduibacter salinus]